MADVVATAGLVIEDAEVVRLAGELAALRGVGVGEAVGEAVREQLKWRREVEERIVRIKEAAAAVRESLIEPLPSSDHSWLYDETGVPV